MNKTNMPTSVKEKEKEREISLGQKNYGEKLLENPVESGTQLLLTRNQERKGKIEDRKIRSDDDSTKTKDDEMVRE